MHLRLLMCRQEFLDIKIQAPTVNIGSGMKDGKLKGKDFFNVKKSYVRNAFARPSSVATPANYHSSSVGQPHLEPDRFIRTLDQFCNRAERYQIGDWTGRALGRD